MFKDGQGQPLKLPSNLEAEPIDQKELPLFGVSELPGLANSHSLPPTIKAPLGGRLQRLLWGALRSSHQCSDLDSFLYLKQLWGRAGREGREVMTGEREMGQS